jgi:hypothetical protein
VAIAISKMRSVRQHIRTVQGRWWEIIARLNDVDLSCCGFSLCGIELRLDVRKPLFETGMKEDIELAMGHTERKCPNRPHTKD